MSALRKLRQLKQNADAAAASPVPASVAEERDDVPRPAKPAGNAFDMLMNDDDNEDESEQASEPAAAVVATDSAADAPAPSLSPSVASAASDDEDAFAASPAPTAAASVAPIAKSKAKKSKDSSAAKSSGGGGKKKGATLAQAAAAAAAPPEKEDWEVEFGAAAAAASSGDAASSAASSVLSVSASSASVWSILSTSAQSLDASAEIRSIFGSGMERRAPGGGGGGRDDDEGGAPGGRGLPPGMNRGGFRKGGAAMVRRVRGSVGSSSASSSSSSSSSATRRMLVRYNPAWSRQESTGMIRAQFVPPMSLPTPPKPVKATATNVSGMHGNIHSLTTSPAEDASVAAATAAAEAEHAAASAAAAEYSSALRRFLTQSQLVLGHSVREYSFVYSADFQHVQEDYHYTVASHDAQALALFASRHPFHPEAQLTMSEIFASQSEYARSHELLLRVLFVYENAWSATGVGGSGSHGGEMGDKIRNGLARIDASLPENAPFFTALARHAQALGKKGCPRTALEVSKLLLSLSPLVDPMCTLLMVDYFALRAKQYRFLIDLAPELDRAIVSAYPVGQHPWAATSAKKSEEERKGAQNANNVATLSSSSSAAAASSNSASSASAAAAVTSLPAPRAPCTFLPNLMYSRALAAWHLEQDASGAGGGDSKKKRGASAATASSSAAAASASAAALFTGAVQAPSLPSASLGGHSMLDADEAAALLAAEPSSSADTQSASYLLQQALLMWPSVVSPLLTAAGAENTLSRPAWVQALAVLNGLYAPASGLGLLFSSSAGSASAAAPNQASTPYLAKLELCFAERSGTLWKQAAVHEWMLANASHLAQSLSSSPSLYSQAVLARFAECRFKYLLSLPFPSPVRGLQKSAYSDHVAHLPPELLMAQQHARGALDIAADRARAHREQMAHNGMRAVDLNQSPLRAFVQSLLPWFAVPEGEGGAAGGEEEGVGEEEALAAIEARLAAMAPQEQAELLQAMGMAQHAQDDEAGAGDAAAAGGIGYEDYAFDEDDAEPQPEA